MPNPFATGASYLIQHTVSGAGIFDGTTAGYPMYTYVAGPISFRVRWTTLGIEGNLQKIALQDAGAGHAVSKTVAHYDPDGKLLMIILRRSNVAILATAAEVVAAVNAYDPTNPGFSKISRMFRAGLIGDGVVAAVAPTLFTGGLTPTWLQGSTKIVLPGGANGGLFYFDQEGPWMVRSVVGKFSVAGPIRVKICNVTPDLRVITSESFTLFTAITDDFTISDIQHPLMPDQAILVITEAPGAQGVAQVTARAESGLPLL